MSLINTDDGLREVLARTQIIAMVGASMNPARASHGVGQFLTRCGYRVIPVNPGHAGETLFGETVRASLAEIDVPVDMVDIFRRSEAVLPVVEEALAQLPMLRTVWMQLGVINEDAAQRAIDKSVDVVMDRCPKIELPRLLPERMPGRS
ncbi:CoA-binding protein [Poseidonocella sedimentorum]|uniref:CoA-binding domain-containing protein n=1 Tax=Poseidonocella sedimentorum TaxID=871652 RepID=A0A1I6CTY5_9RHOB|nr:CoA-binding protein [Poseidonocella sedimentorum]SFQ96592.1 hypothetical protein SAMN04515673_101358 [Poseidonocella sedimentorum]